MKILQVYNEARTKFGGDLVVADATMRVLVQNGHETRMWMKSSSVLDDSVIKRINAFWGGIYNVRSYHEMRRLLDQERPDVVHVHSVYPMFSPSVLVACRRASVPVVMTAHDHKFTCPTAFHLYKGHVCEECIGGHEYRCVMKNCRNNILESIAYALRSSTARRFRYFHDNVSVLIVMTPFGKEKLLQAGFRDDQIAVVPNPVSVKHTTTNPSEGKYVLFAGRINPEKGVDVLLAAAARMPDIPFKVAGDGTVLPEMKARATHNVQFLGRLGPDELRIFYQQSRLLVVPSLSFETFGMSAVEAMALGVPVIASRLGGLTYVVDEGVTGSLFEPGNPEDLVQQIRRLWESPQLCNQMGIAGHQKVLREYTEDAYFSNLMAVYHTAIRRSQSGVTDVRGSHR